MIIHSPKITGSLSFPREDGTEVVLQISTGGELETIEKDSGGNQTSNKPSTNLSGSFTGSFLGDGSNLTGLPAGYTDSDNTDHLNTLGVISGSSQVDADSVTNFDTNVVAGLPVGTLSGSSQVVSSLINQDVALGSGDISSTEGTFSTLGVSGTSTLGVINASGLLSADAGIDVDGAFTVADGTGNISTTGTLGAGNTTISGTADVTGLASLDGGIDVDGAFTVANTSGNVSTSGTLSAGNTDVATLDASGLASLDGGIDVDGAFTVANSTGNISTSGTLNVTGLTTVGVISGSNMDLTGNLTIGGAMTNDGHIIPALHNTYDLGSTTKYWRDLYLSSGSLYINGVQVLSTDGTDLTIQTDAGESVKLLETGNDTITLETENGDITLTSSGTGQVELDANVQIGAGKNILSSDGNAISITDDVTLGSNRLTTGTITLGATAITATGAEINYLAGIDSSISSISLPDNTTISSFGASIIDDADADAVKTTIGLQNVTNESKATMFTSPTFTGTTVAPTPSADDNSTKIATTAYVQTELTALVGNAPAAFDTLGEISASLAADSGALDSLTTVVSGKLQKDQNLSDLSDASTARTNLGVAIGSDVQAHNSTLDTVAAGTYTGDDSITTVGTIATGTWQGSAISTTYISNTSGTNTGDEPDASATTKGIVELATTAETTTGTDATRAVTPDGLKDGYQGSTNVTTLGTIGTGVWQGSVIDSSYLDADPLPDGTISGSAFSSPSQGTVRATMNSSVTDVNVGTTSTSDVTFASIVATDTSNTIKVGDTSSNHLRIDNESVSYVNNQGNQTGYLYLQNSGTVQLRELRASLGVNITSTTASTSHTTGALKVAGGAGISGALNVGGDIIAYASSDERLKDNIELISNPIEKVQSLKGVTWNWNEKADELQQSLPKVGVIAQDVEKVLPELVTDRENGYKGVDYAKLTGLLIEAIKEQQKQIDDLKSKLG